jgi:two-component system response regulator
MMSKDPVPVPIEILVVDDNPGDVQLIVEALEDAKLANQLHAVGDGVAAMAFLRRETPYQNVPRPNLILLDLNLPKKDGRAVLKEIKADPDLREIPVVVLTTSRADADIVKAYNLNANCYITKPVDFEQFINLLRAIDHFWFTIVTLPPKRAGQ